MRNSLQIYLKQICPAVEWDARNNDGEQGIKAQYASTLLSEEQAKKELAVLDAKKETIGLNIEFSIFESRQNAGQYRIVCNLKKELDIELDKQKLDEVSQFLNEIYGSLAYVSFSEQKIARWDVTEGCDGYLIIMVGPTYYTNHVMPMDDSVQRFILGRLLENTDIEHPCKPSVVKLATTRLRTKMHKECTVYYWDTKGVNELYELMQNHKKTTTYADSNISSEVAAEALSDIPELPPEIGYHVGFFLNLSDAGVLAQVKPESQNTLRHAKVACEVEEPQNTLSI